MKKIKSIKQLKEEKKRLAARCAGLEDDIKYHWHSIKQNAVPGIFDNSGNNKDAERATGSRIPGGNIAGDILMLAASLLAQKFAGKLGDKFVHLFKK